MSARVSLRMAVCLPSLSVLALSLACGGGSTPTTPAAAPATPTVASVGVAGAPTNGQILVGKTLQLAASARDAAGKDIPNTPFTWKSSDTSKASVDANGLVSGLVGGPVNITAQVGTVSSTPVSLTVVPNAATVEERQRALALTRNLLSSGGLMGMPGGPMLVTARGTFPVLSPALPPEAQACGQVTINGGTTVIDFNGCPNMSGSVSFTTTASTDGSFRQTTTYNHFSYAFGVDGSTYGTSIHGTTAAEGVINTSGTTLAYALRITSGTGGLAISVKTPTVQESWVQTMDLSSTFTYDATTTRMTEWGTSSYTGSLGTYSASIPKESPLTWDFRTCFYPLSGVLNWTINGTPMRAVFSTPCGTVTLDGVQVVHLQ